MGGIGPMFGQVGFFHKFAGKEYDDKRPRDRYVAEAKRLLGVLDKRLESREWIMGDEYGVADITTFPWVRKSHRFLRGAGSGGFPRVCECAACARCVSHAAGRAAWVEHSKAGLTWRNDTTAHARHVRICISHRLAPLRTACAARRAQSLIKTVRRRGRPFQPHISGRPRAPADRPSWGRRSCAWTGSSRRSSRTDARGCSRAPHCPSYTHSWRSG